MRKTKYVFIYFFVVSFFICAAHAERPIVTSIKTEYRHDKSDESFLISWKLPETPETKITSFFLYRDTKPITSIAAIQPIARLSADTTSAVDKVSDFKDYYYAVAAITEKGVYAIILPQINATATSVRRNARRSVPEITEDISSERIYPAGVSRESPLPKVEIMKNTDIQKISNTAMSHAADLLDASFPNTNDNTNNNTNLIDAKNSPYDGSDGKLIQSEEKAKSKIMSPYVFEEDYFSPDGGDAYILFDTLHKTFARKKYKEAIEKLTDLTGTNLTPEVVTRGKFYLGQSYYFIGEYHRAVHYFLATAESYPTLSRIWIDATLERIKL